MVLTNYHVIYLLLHTYNVSVSGLGTALWTPFCIIMPVLGGPDGGSLISLSLLCLEGGGGGCFVSLSFIYLTMLEQRVVGDGVPPYLVANAVALRLKSHNNNLKMLFKSDF